MWTVIGTIAIVAATLGVGLVIERRWGPRRLADAAKPQLHEPGTAPATAIATTPGELELLRRTQQCPKCRAAMEVAADQRVTYDGSELLVLRLACPRCSTVRSVYVSET